MVIIKLFLFTLFISKITAPYTTLGWNSCSTAAQVPKIKIERLSMLPMPIKNPGTETIDFRALAFERIQGRLPIQFDIVRTVAGLALPIRCTIAQGIPLGSCSYQDFCKDIVQDMCGFNASNCPPELADYGIDCNCPFNIPVQTFDNTFEFDIKDLSIDVPVPCPFFFLLINPSGDYDAKLIVNNAANQHVACFRFLFTLVKA